MLSATVTASAVRFVIRIVGYALSCDDSGQALAWSSILATRLGCLAAHLISRSRMVIASILLRRQPSPASRLHARPGCPDCAPNASLSSIPPPSPTTSSSRETDPTPALNGSRYLRPACVGGEASQGIVTCEGYPCAGNKGMSLTGGICLLLRVTREARLSNSPAKKHSRARVVIAGDGGVMEWVADALGMAHEMRRG